MNKDNKNKIAEHALGIMHAVRRVHEIVVVDDNSDPQLSKALNAFCREILVSVTKLRPALTVSPEATPAVEFKRKQTSTKN